LTTLTYKDSEGGIGYRFDSKGMLTIEAVGFSGKFDVKDGSGTLPLEIKMNGFARGNYTIDGDTVVPKSKRPFRACLYAPPAADAPGLHPMHLGPT
jgi:hypothetical protein